MTEQLSVKEWERLQQFSAIKQPEEVKRLTAVDAFFISFFISLVVILYAGAWLKVYNII